MWLTKLTIITLLLLATGYVQSTQGRNRGRNRGRPRPTRLPPTEAPDPEDSGCFAELQAQQEIMVQSNLPTRYLVVSRRGSSRMFGRTFNNLDGQSDLQLASATDTYNTTNGISVVTTTRKGKEQVSKLISLSRIPLGFLRKLPGVIGGQ